MLQPVEFVSRYHIAPWERLFACYPWVHGANSRMANRSPARAPLPDAVLQHRLQDPPSLFACFRALQTLLDCSRECLTSLRATPVGSEGLQVPGRRAPYSSTLSGEQRRSLILCSLCTQHCAMLQPVEFVSRYHIAPWERLFACSP